MRDQRGLSLVELIFAFAIVTLVITISMAAFVERKRRSQQASEIILAYQALANEAEYRRRISYDRLDPSLESWKTDFMSPVDVLAPLDPFATIVSVKDVEPGVKNVTMTIRWKNGERQAKLELVRVDTGGTNLW